MVELLRPALEAADTAVRIEAIYALGRIADPVAAHLLLKATLDRNFDVRSAAIKTFDGLGTTAVVWAAAAEALNAGAIGEPEDQLVLQPAAEPAAALAPFEEDVWQDTAPRVQDSDEALEGDKVADGPAMPSPASDDGLRADRRGGWPLGLLRTVILVVAILCAVAGTAILVLAADTPL